MRLLRWAIVFAAILVVAPAARAQTASQSVAVKLFAKSEVDLRKGCSVALWQANRDRDRDNYAYIFVEALASNHARQPAKMKIGDSVVRMRRVATGGKEGGYNLFPYQLYKLDTANSFVVLELKVGEIEGEAVDLDGWLHVVEPDKLPARVAVKGGAGCY
jgi:hypothetical protein